MKNNNVKFWRNISWLNLLLKQTKQSTLADWMNWPTGEYVAMELGDSPTIDQLSELHEAFGLSYQDLISEDVSTMRTLVLRHLEENGKSMLCQEPAPIYEIPLYSQKASAASMPLAATASRPDNNIAHICVPQSFFAAYPGEALTAFEIEGYSMHPSVKSGDIVLGSAVEELTRIQDGKCYILLLKDNSLLFKRCYHLPDSRRHNGLQLSSDNLDYHSFEVKSAQIQKIWKVTSLLENV